MSNDNTATPPVNPPEVTTESPQAQSHEPAKPASPTTPTTPPVVMQSSLTPASNPIPQSTQVTQNTQEHDALIDPKVSALRAMFPDFDDAVLQSVLESVGGDQDRAIDVLLGMNDPDYLSEMPPQEPVMSQTELDERLARQLYLEDEQRQQQRQAAWEAQQRSSQSQWGGVSSPASQPPSNAGERDTMTEIGDQFNRIAETGKKTLGNIFSRVKAKMQEFDQSNRQNQASTSTPSNLGASGAMPEAQGQYQQYQPHQRQQHQQPAYYDPNPQSQSPSAAGYDATLSPSLDPSAKTVTSETPRPPATGSGSGIDTGKLGLLPKQPVSLLRADNTPGQTQPQSQSRRDDDDDDELEYAENPFEEGRK